MAGLVAEASSPARARKMGTPCCCERCGFITADQMMHLTQSIRKQIADKIAKKRDSYHWNDAHVGAVWAECEAIARGEK